ncbi:MAG: hypothetical protein E6R08_09090 [Nevskiaceae bacterium]|nr:MAG: hypothetical protein E6R08_09090 [Nevskiaceae bacterium]
MKASIAILRVNTQQMDQFRAGLAHKLTMVNVKATPEGSLCGTTVWGKQDKSASVYWGWTLTAQGIVVITDPLAIRSNLLFTDGEQMLPFERQLLEVNKLVHGMQWQEHVKRHLSEPRVLRGVDRKEGGARTRDARRAPSRGGVGQPLAA